MYKYSIQKIVRKHNACYDKIAAKYQYSDKSVVKQHCRYV